jgi:predicted PurR-regulated permease PerM
MNALEDKFFLLLVVAASLAFGWILWPLYSAVLWGVVAAIVFAPLYRWLLKSLGGRPNLAAVATVFIIVMMVILPLTLIGAALTQEAAGVYGRFQSGELSLVRLFQQVLDALPNWVSNLMSRFGVSSLGALQERLAAGLQKGSEFLAGQAINLGQSTADFVVNLAVMLYLLFFLLRDGDALAKRIKAALPLRENQRSELFVKFTIVIRATVKGNILIALMQGALGGAMFWFLGISASLLWAVVMAFLSLLPAIGAGLVWIPVALYLLATGAIWQGLTLIAFGSLVIGLVDNALRPVLVGKDTKLPDYVVLISTLGGIEAFGLNGFVVGPVIAAMFVAVWDLLSATRKESEAAKTNIG